MDPDVNMFYYGISIVTLIIISGFFSVCEGAIVSMNDSKLRKLAEEGDKRAIKILAMTGEPTVFLATVQTGVTICGFFAAATLAKSFPQISIWLTKLVQIDLSLAYSIVLATMTFLLSLVMILFGKLFPKRISSYYCENIALNFATLFWILSKILRPVVILLSKTTDMMLKLFGIKPSEEPENLTEEEIRMMVDVGEEKGVIEQSEKEMINNIFEFDDRNVSEIMTHRMDVISVKKTATYDEIIEAAMQSGYSRLPVYDEDMDNIIGIIYIKDLLKYMNRANEFSLEETIRDVLFVPESTCCTELLKVFKKHKKQMAVIVDEYGGTYGIVTMEDLLESIVGDIQDEYDNEEEEIQTFSDGSFTFDGSLSIDVVEQVLNVEIVSDDDDYDTLGAALIHKIGHIPKEEENAIVIMSGVLFRIIEVDDRRIIKVKAEFLNDELDENSNNIY
ncbi:MAG: hemolysin family protein [Oscillospiraceae bacterium]